MPVNTLPKLTPSNAVLNKIEKKLKEKKAQSVKRSLGGKPGQEQEDVPEDVLHLASEASKSVMLIPSRTSKIHLFEDCGVEFTPGYVREACSSRWSTFGPFIWRLYIEALLVPYFRYEWVKYRFWTAAAPIQSDKDRVKRRKHRKYKQYKTKVFQEKYKFFTKEYRGHPHDHENCTRVRINVSGLMFETQLRTLQRYPGTLLGNAQRRLRFYDPQEECYYFDRSRESFEMILYYYQSGGRLRRPYEVDTAVFYNEVVFFDLGDDVLTDFRVMEGLYAGEDDVKVLPKNLFQRKIWLLFEYPESSALATIVAFTSVISIILSISSFCVETMPDFDIDDVDDPDDLNDDDNGENISKMSDVFNFIETVCVAWFVLELVVRLLSCPKKIPFMLDIMNVIDFVAVVPFFVQLGTSWSGHQNDNFNHLEFLRVIRLVRVFRIFKLSRHSEGLQILGLTLKASLRELALLIFFLGIGVILFSSAVYFAELDTDDSMYPSIPSSFYWGAVTMTTVGYGDIVPFTILGKLIGTACAVSGVLTIALPVPVIVSNFNFFYSRSQDKKKGENNLYNPQHVKMCAFLPGNGIHPDAPMGFDGTNAAVFQAHSFLDSSASLPDENDRSKSKNVNFD